MNIKPVNGTWVNVDDIKPFTMSTSTNTEGSIKNEMYANWCIDFMNKIEEIAHKKYPNQNIWVDTGSRYNVIMAMLQQFEDDLKVRK